MKRKLLAFGLATLSLWFVACEKNANEAKSDANLNSTSSVNSTEQNPKNSQKEEKKDIPKAVIKFETETYNFGTINQGEQVTYTYKFKNEGKNPLIIESAKASCGCTVPTYPKEPIPPGGTGEIIAQYNGSGSGDVTKTITITANTEPSTTVLSIKGFVRPKTSQNEEVNKMKGPLRNQ